MTASGGALLRREADGIAEVVLDRPDAMNALNTATLLELTAHFTAMAADPEIRVVVLSSAAERAFCVGADLKERAAMSDAQIMAQRPVFRAAFGALLALPMPAIAVVHGYALGVGLVPGCGGTQLLARRIGPGRAADMIFSGRKASAEEAHAIGLADRLVPAGSARTSALELASEIAANSPVAVRAAKQALRNGAGLSLAAALDVEDAAWRTAAGSADRREGIAAFAEKRRPVWPTQAAQAAPVVTHPHAAGRAGGSQEGSQARV